MVTRVRLRRARLAAEVTGGASAAAALKESAARFSKAVDAAEAEAAAAAPAEAPAEAPVAWDDAHYVNGGVLATMFESFSLGKRRKSRHRRAW